jgi:spectinomycin phosphotransferase
VGRRVTQNRNSNVEQIAQFLEGHYALTIERIEPAPRGWVGETYYVAAGARGRVFVKVYRKGLLPPNALAALPVLAELHRRGMSQITYPIASSTGALHEPLGDDVVVVLNYIDAAHTDFFVPRQLGDLGDLIARLHDLTAQIETPVVAEPFQPYYGDELWRTFSRARGEPGSDDLRIGLQRFLAERSEELAHHWESFAEVARRCREAQFELVITHGDAPWNVLKDDAGTIHLIDWDGLLLAPLERDTWFFTDKPEFMRAYSARRGERTPNALATTFYLYDRYFEELLGFSNAILDEGTPEHRSAALGFIVGEWMSGLRSQIRALPESSMASPS